MANMRLLDSLRDGLLAVLAGNAIYFVLMPHLPEPLRHVPFRHDLGLLVDFLFCFAIFGLVRWFTRTDRRGKARPR
jgi:hypothetical protein